MYSVKTDIIKNNLCGVDLDNKALEITKLNLLLKAAENGRKLPDEQSHQTAYDCKKKKRAAHGLGTQGFSSPSTFGVAVF
jgi:hypothetical protein